MKLIQMPPHTFSAKLFEVSGFKVAGTLEGTIDLATLNGTYLLSLDEAYALSKALADSIADVRDNCLYEKDSLLRST